MGGSGVKKDLFANSGTAQGMSNTLTGNAANLYGSLAPELQAEAAHPSGYSPTDLASMNTAAQQSAGGSMAGATGQGALLASRTKNAGTADSAIAKSGENAGESLSRAALGVETGNANLKQHQQQEALQGMGSLYGTDLSGGMNALGLSNQALGAAGDQHPFWQTLLTQQVQNTEKAAADAAAAGGG